jgi:L-amino acid N-acyltransferase YncA
MAAPGKPNLSSPEVRDALEADMAAVRDVYAHYVLHSLATFEETAPTLGDMLARRRVSVDLGLPYLVAEVGGGIAGIAYAGLYRSRPAYRFAIEDSVYVADGQAGRGIGSALLGELIARCDRGPWRQMVAIVGGSGNLGSIALHRRFGFELVGTL